MFRLLDNNPASHPYILLPAYDPTMEYYTRMAVARASARTPFCPDQEARGDSAGPLMAPGGRSEQRPAALSNGARGNRIREAPGEAEALRSSDHVVPDATGKLCRTARLRYAFRSRRDRDGGGSFERRATPRFDNEASKAGASPAEGQTSIVPRVRIRL